MSRTVQSNYSFVDEKDSMAQIRDRPEIVADQYDCSPLFTGIIHFAETLLLKSHISDRQHFID